MKKTENKRVHSIVTLLLPLTHFTLLELYLINIFATLTTAFVQQEITACLSFGFVKKMNLKKNLRIFVGIVKFMNLSILKNTTKLKNTKEGYNPLNKIRKQLNSLNIEPASEYLVTNKFNRNDISRRTSMTILPLLSSRIIVIIIIFSMMNYY